MNIAKEDLQIIKEIVEEAVNKTEKRMIDRITETEERLTNTIDERITASEQHVIAKIDESELRTNQLINDMANIIDKRFDEVDKQFTEVDKRFTKMDKRFDDMGTKIDTAEQNLKNELRQRDDMSDQDALATTSNIRKLNKRITKLEHATA